MATLVLGGLGTLVGGPLGGAIGAAIGRSLDSKIIGSGSREGPRLKELAISTSTYGSAIPRHFGTVRAAGSIIWSTELIESKETSGGGKGKPKSTTYSYSVSLAVALASRPIQGIGRIWADGNLLRGAAGDLKTGGTLRIYEGHGDQMPDPLMASAMGQSCPAFRGTAYCVFEDLQLEDFGNRIPVLSFEILADHTQVNLEEIVEPLAPESEANVPLVEVSGFSYEGGALHSTIDLIGTLYPLSIRSQSDTLSILPDKSPSTQAPLLPEAVSAWETDDFGQQNGTSIRRAQQEDVYSHSIRYYDIGRDYQPGVQRSLGRAPLNSTNAIEFPGTLSASGATKLINRVEKRKQIRRQNMQWRMAVLDTQLMPGAYVQVPQESGQWIIKSWEWREGGIELGLERAPTAANQLGAGDNGAPNLAIDLLQPPTFIRLIDLPWDGNGSPDEVTQFAALSSTNAHWRGAALYASNSDGLEPIGVAGREQSIMGSLTTPLPPSESHLFQREAHINVELNSSEMALRSRDINALANGANRLLVGEELIQFASAVQIGARTWRLSGLLRGRGATEVAAKTSKPVGAAITLLDTSLIPLSTLSDSGADNLGSTNIFSSVENYAAIGRGDSEPVFAGIENAGRSLRPLTPVHPQVMSLPSGAIELAWTRRARGAWGWPDEVGTPLNEEMEQYRIGIGSVQSPLFTSETQLNRFTVSSSQLSNFAGQNIWVQQVGKGSVSEPLYLHGIAAS